MVEFDNRKDKKDMRELSKRRDSFGIYDPFFDGFFGFPSISNEFKHFDKVMKTDVQEHENDYELEIEMPGFDKNDINLDLNNGYLTIEAKQNSEDSEKDKKGNYIRRERYYGSCTRSFYVGDIKEEDIKAKLDKGVLKITVPKEKKLESKKKILID